MKTLLSLTLLATCIIIHGQSPQVQELGKLYMSGELDQTISKANEFLANDRNNVDYKLILGRALADKGLYEAAVPHLMFSAENDRANSWRKAWALGYLGTCYYMLENFENSENSLKACIQLNATRNATQYAQRRISFFGYNTIYSDWEIRESKNIRFHFQNAAELDLDRYIKLRADAFAKINDFFDSKLPKKIDFFAWDSREDAQRILQRNLGFADPATCIVHSRVQQTPGHEITHVISNYTNTMIRKTGLINEGTSVCFDMSNNNREQIVSSYLKNHGESIDIRDVWSNWNKYPQELSYPLAGLFVTALIERYGRDEFLNFFPRQTYENARAVFGEDLNVMIKEFETAYND